MLPATYQALLIIILAIEPGFLAVSCWARAKTWKGRGTDLSTILNSLAVSLVIQIAASPLTIAWLLPVRDRLPEHAWRLRCGLLWSGSSLLWWADWRVGA